MCNSLASSYLPMCAFLLRCSLFDVLFAVMYCRKSLSLVKELIETCLVESDGSIQLHAAKVFYISDHFVLCVILLVITLFPFVMGTRVVSDVCCYEAHSIYLLSSSHRPRLSLVNKCCCLCNSC